MLTKYSEACIHSALKFEIAKDPKVYPQDWAFYLFKPPQHLESYAKRYAARAIQDVTELFYYHLITFLIYLCMSKFFAQALEPTPLNLLLSRISEAAMVDQHSELSRTRASLSWDPRFCSTST